MYETPSSKVIIETRWNAINISDVMRKFGTVMQKNAHFADENEWHGKCVTVFGLNRSGLAVAELLVSLGARVAVTDTRTATALATEIARYRQFAPNGTLYLGGHPAACIADAELIVVSPGVPLDIPILREARAKNIPIWGELEVSARVCPAPIVAITGTKGKSTTTLLTAALLKAGGTFKHVCVAGNIGVPLAAEVQHLTPRDIVVLEASSFQLESTVTFHPHVSVVLNISPDHLDRHGSMAAYDAAKQKICANQTGVDWLVLNRYDCSARFASCTSAQVMYWTDEPSEKWAASVPIPGVHNVQNALAAITVAKIFGVTDSQIREALKNFDRGHPAFAHAFELVKTHNGVQFINDSKATNVAAVKAALESVESCTSSTVARGTVHRDQEGSPTGGNRDQEGSPTGKTCTSSAGAREKPGHRTRNVWLIAGGVDKGNDYTPLTSLIRQRVKGAILLGKHTQRLEESLSGLTDIFHAASMTEAVQIGFANAAPGDVVLLSPANASFDMFTDYKARGDAFKEAVHEIPT